MCLLLQPEIKTQRKYEDKNDEDTLVIEETRPVFEGEVMVLDLSSYGTGDYQVVITGVGDDTLYGNF